MENVEIIDLETSNQLLDKPNSPLDFKTEL